jgi:O-antigen biosynthesis protein
VPKILYHWRAVPGSTAASGDSKPASFEAGRRAVAEALQRRGRSATAVIQPDWAIAGKCAIFEIVFPDTGPTVTIIIPTRNQLVLLRACLESLSQTSYQNYEVLVVDNESDDQETLCYLEEIRVRPRMRVMRIAQPGGRFNYAALNNRAVLEVETDYLLFLNNDTAVRSSRWLSQMVGHAGISGVGAVGARLTFENQRIQHAGVVNGYHGGLAGHAFRNKPPHDWGYMGFIRTSREYSAVTAACMLTPRDLFLRMGGFDEQDFAVSYNDADYCYRIVEAGLRCVYCAEAELFHFEGKSRGFEQYPLEVDAYRRKWGCWRDRWYNPNLSLENEWFEPAAVRPEIREPGPVRVVLVSHALNREPASVFLFDLAMELLESGAITATVVSPMDGPLRGQWESAGIAVRILPPNAGWPPVSQSVALFQRLRPAVVLANSLDAFWAIPAATSAGIPSVWNQPESESHLGYFDCLPVSVRTVAADAFVQAYRVVYVAEAPRRAWRVLETRGNFERVRYEISEERLNKVQPPGKETLADYTRILRQAAGLQVSAPVMAIAQGRMTGFQNRAFLSRKDQTE